MLSGELLDERNWTCGTEYSRPFLTAYTERFWLPSCSWLFRTPPTLLKLSSRSQPAALAESVRRPMMVGWEKARLYAALIGPVPRACPLVSDTWLYWERMA